MSDELVEQLVAENKQLREQLSQVSIPVTLSFSNAKFMESDGIIEFTAVGLCEGTWKGVFYPLEEIKKLADNWVELGRPKIPLLVEHGKDEEFGIKAVGEVYELRFDDDLKALFIKGRITDPKAIKKVKEGEFNHVSLAHFINLKEVNHQNVASDLNLVEVSLTRAPACPSCTILNVQELGEFELKVESDLAYPIIPKVPTRRLVPVYRYPLIYGIPYVYPVPYKYPTPYASPSYGYPYAYPVYGYPYGYPAYGYPAISPEDIQGLMDRITQLEERVQALEEKVAELSKAKVELSETTAPPREAVTTAETTAPAQATEVKEAPKEEAPSEAPTEAKPEVSPLEERVAKLESSISQILEIVQKLAPKEEPKEAPKEEPKEEPKTEESKPAPAPSEAKPEEKPQIDISKVDPLELVIAYGRKKFGIEE